MKRKVWKLVEPPGTNAKTKVAKLNAEQKTIGILDFKQTHCAMRSLSVSVFFGPRHAMRIRSHYLNF